MKKGESLGSLIGALAGAVLTGIAIYLTGSVLCALISPVCFCLGGWIGKEFDKR